MLQTSQFQGQSLLRYVQIQKLMDRYLYSRSPSIDDDPNDNLYVVEKILKKKITASNQIFYYVRWEGYPDPEDHTWEPLQNLISVPTMIEEFEAKLEKQKRDQMEQQSRKKDENKKEDKFEAKQNNPDFRKLQNQGSQMEGLPRKLIKSREQQNTINPEKKKSKQNQVPLESHKNDQISSTFVRERSKEEKKKGNHVYGKVVNHFYKSGELFYEIQWKDNDKVKKIDQISSQKASSECLTQAFRYLQKLVIDLEENIKS